MIKHHFPAPSVHDKFAKPACTTSISSGLSLASASPPPAGGGGGGGGASEGVLVEQGDDLA
jgi:hypothetical protein